MLNKKSLVTILNVVTVLSAFASVSAEARRSDHQKTQSEYVGEGWNRGYYFPFVDTLSRLPNLGAQTSDDQARCDRFYSRINQKRQIKIILGLGYYDDSEGQPFQVPYRDDFGMSHMADFGMNATVDNAYMTMYASILTRRCHGRLQVCGFDQQSPNLFTKSVRSPNGDRINVQLEMRNGSLTEQNSENTGPLREQQTEKTAETTNWFFGSMASADLAIYNGHSRKGGGPDFAPPRLFKNFHVNYPFYAATTPGLTRLLNSLRADEAPSALMMMSCNSTKLFQNKIAAVAPRTAFTGTNEIIPGDIPTKGALAGIDSMLRFQCESGFNTELSATPEIQEHLTHLSFK